MSECNINKSYCFLRRNKKMNVNENIYNSFHSFTALSQDDNKTTSKKKKQ